MSYYVRYYLLLYVVNIDIDLTDVKRDDGKCEYSTILVAILINFHLLTLLTFSQWVYQAEGNVKE